MASIRSFRSIKLPPNWSLGFVGKVDDGERYIELESPPQPDAYKDDGSMFPGGFSMNVPGKDPLLELVTVATMYGLHEALEFIRDADGNRLADPHPGREEDAMWTWLRDEVQRILCGYRDRWPVAETEGRETDGADLQGVRTSQR